MEIRTLSPDMTWQRVSPDEAILNIVMILEIQLLNGLKKFDSDVADKYCEVCFWNWFLNLEYKIGNDFANNIRNALFKLPLSGALNEVRRLWRSHELGYEVDGYDDEED